MASPQLIVAAKEEYTIQLCNGLYTALYQGLKSIWNDSKKSSRIDPNNPNALKNFQERLAMIPKWNQDAIDDEYARIVSETGIEYYDKLIEQVFLANVQVLSAIRAGSKELEIKLRVPKAKVFVHKCYIQCARELFQEPQLFEDRMGGVVTYDNVQYEEPKKIETSMSQQNFRECLSIINKSIQKAIRDLIPIEEILNQSLKNDDDENENSDNDELSSHGSNKSGKNGNGNEGDGDESEDEHAGGAKIPDNELLEHDFESLQNPAKVGDSDTEFSPKDSDHSRPSTPHGSELPSPQEQQTEVRNINIAKEAQDIVDGKTMDLPLPPIVTPGTPPPEMGHEPTFFSDAESD